MNWRFRIVLACLITARLVLTVALPLRRLYLRIRWYRQADDIP